MATEKKHLYLLDAMALAYRAHFIFINRPLVNSKGFNTSATYGFTSALIKLIEDNGIDHIAVVFDVMEEGGTFRDELYDQYKAHRDPPPEDLLANLPPIKRIVRAFDIPVVEIGGVEADDVIGTLARQAERDGAHAVIVSPDKDFQQLLSPSVSIFRPAYRGEEFDAITDESFREKYGLEPVQFIDLLALMGDSADNVPGVHGIGEKTAVKLIQEYGSVEELLEHTDEISGKRAREGLQNHREDALLSKKLVTIRTDVPTTETWDDFTVRHPDLAEVRKIFDELEFSRLYERVERVVGAKRVVTEDAKRDTPTIADSLFDTGSDLDAWSEKDVDYRTARTLGDVADLVASLKGAEAVAIDTETTSLDAMMASLVGVSVSGGPGTAWYVPTPLPDGTDTSRVLAAMETVFASETLKIGQNLKYDLTVLGRHGVELNGPLFDTMVAHYLIAPEEAHGMDHLARTLLGYQTIPISDLIGRGKEQVSMRDVPVVKVAPYACEDADITFRLYNHLAPRLQSDGLLEIAESMEFPLVRTLAHMEQTGILLDTDVLSELSVRIAEDLEKLETDIHEAAGESFNIGSPAQIGTILFEKLELPVLEKTSKGKASTKESVLQQLASEHALPAMILDWRELAKLKSTYVDSLPSLVHPETRRVHTSYSQTTAATGRLASSNPNLQNIPIRTERGREIRRAFVAQDGWLLLSADYSQIELRILASLSGDSALAEAFADGQDIHRATAATVFKVPLDDVTDDQRRKAKEVNYGIPYGVSGYGLAQRLRCSVGEAQELIDTYMKSYPGVASFLHDQVEKARECGYAETLLGRRRYVADINARNRNVRSFAERVAINMPIQGSQADMIKLAMVHLEQALLDHDLKARMLLQVHDELVLEVPKEEVDAVKPLVRNAMVTAMPLNVPIEVTMDTGTNWLEAH
jgi:DNA polymerase-1